MRGDPVLLFTPKRLQELKQRARNPTSILIMCSVCTQVEHPFLSLIYKNLELREQDFNHYLEPNVHILTFYIRKESTDFLMLQYL